MGVYTDLREKLISDYATLSPQMQKAARHILDHPNDVALRSMRALARAANVPPSTVTRLMAAIGVDTWQQFRDSYQNRLLDLPASYAHRARALQNSDADIHRDAHLLQSIAQAEIANIGQVFAPEMCERMKDACEHIARARQVLSSGVVRPIRRRISLPMPIGCLTKMVFWLTGMQGHSGTSCAGLARGTF